MPVWGFLIGIVLAAGIAAAAAYFLVGGDDEGGDSAAAAVVVEGLMQLGQPTQITSYPGELPPDFPLDFPKYENADVVVSIATPSETGTGYLIVMSTSDPASNVYDFYSQALDEGPWQVEIGRSSADFTGVRFLRPDNIDVTGDVSLYESSMDDQTVIYLSYNDVSLATPPGENAPFTLGATRPLPVGFPEDIPVYEGAEPSVILDTYFERGQGGQAFIVTFLTRETPETAVDFYRGEFEARGWTVTEAATEGFAVGIEFDDGADQSISGSVTADAFADDNSFTQVDLLVTTSNSR